MTSDLNDVIVLVRVVETGSFSGAARRLGVPKSTVSRRIARLERDLGARLLQRTTRRLSLTDAGQIYYRHCSRVLAELDEAHRTVSGMQQQPSGVLRLTAPHDLAAIVSTLIADFSERYPEVRVVTEMTTRVIDLVAEGFDLALRAGQLHDSSLIARRLASFDVVLYASPQYLERCGMPELPRHLANHRCLTLGSQRTSESWQLTGPDGAETVEVQAFLASNDVTLLCNAAAAGMGIANLPTLTCREDEKAGRLVRVLPTYRGGETGLYAVFPTGEHLAPKVRRFVELAAVHMSRLAEP